MSAPAYLWLRRKFPALWINVNTHNHTLNADSFDNIYVLGDTTALPTSKAGSVGHFSAEITVKNFMREINGEPLREDLDGHANCFIETGFDKAPLIDFNYDYELLPGKFPLPGLDNHKEYFYFYVKESAFKI